MIDASSQRFLDSLASFDRFVGVADAANYKPLPDGWWLATADIVGSTKAIAAGRYKAVNMAGASVISAVLNTLGHRNIPFVFGGDGALVAIPGGDVAKTRTALAAVQTWAAEELGLVAARRPRTHDATSASTVTMCAWRASRLLQR